MMPDVKNYPVLRISENPLKTTGKLDNAEIGGKVSAVTGNDIDYFFSDFSAQGSELIFCESGQVPRTVNFSEKVVHLVRLSLSVKHYGGE